MAEPTLKGVRVTMERYPEPESGYGGGYREKGCGWVGSGEEVSAKRVSDPMT